MVKKNVRRILNGLFLPVLVVNRKGEVEFANSAGRERFGKTITKKKIHKIIQEDAMVRALESVFNGKELETFEITLPDVVPTEFRITVVRLGPEDGEIVRASISFEDISHIREAVQMRSDFVANVSHELRSPLTAIMGTIETLKGPAKGDADAQEHFLKLMEEETNRMTLLVQDLLSLSKLQAHTRDQPDDRVDVHQLLQGVITTLTTTIQSEGVAVDFRDKSKESFVYGDSQELRQVFQNLIENAIKYSSPGTRVQLTVKTPKTEKGFLQIDVKDQGEGIEPVHIPRLTERFYRIDKGRSRSKGGTGLGLAIVKHILIRHRGRLDIQSKVGKGSTFQVFLPLASQV